MSYQIDFFISCPQDFVRPPYHVSVIWVETPDTPEPFFTYPGGCGGYRDCPACNWCLKTIREMFISGEISFYRDPSSVYGTYHTALTQPVHPHRQAPASGSP